MKELPCCLCVGLSLKDLTVADNGKIWKCYLKPLHPSIMSLTQVWLNVLFWLAKHSLIPRCGSQVVCDVIGIRQFFKRFTFYFKLLFYLSCKCETFRMLALSMASVFRISGKVNSFVQTVFSSVDKWLNIWKKTKFSAELPIDVIIHSAVARYLPYKTRWECAFEVKRQSSFRKFAKQLASVTKDTP